MKTYEKYKDRGVLFVGLTPDRSDKLADVKEFIKEYDIPWPNAYGAGKTIDDFEVTGYPTLFVINKQGLVHWNDYQGGDLESAIEGALAEEREEG